MYTLHCPRSKTGQTIVCLRPGETTTFMAISVVVLLYPTSGYSSSCRNGASQKMQFDPKIHRSDSEATIQYIFLYLHWRPISSLYFHHGIPVYCTQQRNQDQRLSLSLKPGAITDLVTIILRAFLRPARAELPYQRAPRC